MFMNEIKDSRYVYPVNTITCDIRTYSKLNHWEYGDIRGGTPAVFIANLGYLAFFHSTLPNSKEQHEAVFMNGVKDSQYVHPVESIQCGLRKFNKKYYWVYGDFRGGTSAILIPNLGAYVISTTTPFKLLRISTNPIITSDLIYDPIQDPRPRKESIVFPMSYYPVDVNGKPIDTTNSNVKPKKLVLTIGYKDQYGKVLRIDYDKLIDSLTEVHC
eukprot:gene19150-24991_t